MEEHVHAAGTGEKVSGNGTLVFIWWAYFAIMLTVVAAVIFWAVRSGQFRNQDRAQSLPLSSPDLGNEEKRPGDGGQKAESPQPDEADHDSEHRSA